MNDICGINGIAPRWGLWLGGTIRSIGRCPMLMIIGLSARRKLAN